MITGTIGGIERELEFAEGQTFETEDDGGSAKVSSATMIAEMARQAQKPDTYSINVVNTEGVIDLNQGRAFEVADGESRVIQVIDTVQDRTGTVLIRILGGSPVTWIGDVFWDGDLEPELGAVWTIVSLLFFKEAIIGRVLATAEAA